MREREQGAGLSPTPSARWWREGVGDEGVKGGRSRVRLRIEKKEKMEEAKIEKSKEGGGGNKQYPTSRRINRTLLTLRVDGDAHTHTHTHTH